MAALDDAKKVEIIADASERIRKMARDAFERAREHGEEISPVTFLAIPKGAKGKVPLEKIATPLGPENNQTAASIMIVDCNPWFEDERMKSLFPQFIRKLIDDTGAVFVAVVSEVWMAAAPKDSYDGTPPSQMANREEALSIMESSPYGAGMVQAKITRKRGEDNHFRELGKWEEPFAGKAELSGRFANFFDVDLSMKAQA